MSRELSRPTTSNAAGFSLIEVLVAMAVILLVLGGTLSIMSDTMKAQQTAKDLIDMNSTLRASMDLIERDLLQVGQGLPVGRRIGIPNGTGATLIKRPGPAASRNCAGVTTFPDDASIPAVSVGPELGPALNGRCTDVITILAADNVFGPVPVAAIGSDGTTLTIHDSVDISDDPDIQADNLRPGDLLMITKGANSVLMQVTDVDGQVVTFGTGDQVDPLGLNQFGSPDGMLGTINRLKADGPEDPDDVQVDAGGDQEKGPSTATRIRMITYFVDATDPVTPRLMRIVGGAEPNVVGFGVQALTFSYDITDQVDNPSAVRMTDADVSGSGACSPNPCSVDQIRKVNLMLSMEAYTPNAADGRYRGSNTQNTLFSQVSLRSMAFVDRYR